MASLIFHGIAYPYGAYYDTQNQGTPPRLNLLTDKIYAGVGQVPSYDWKNPNLLVGIAIVAVTAQPLGTPPRLNLLKDKVYAGIGQVPTYVLPNPNLPVSSYAAVTSQVLGIPLAERIAGNIPAGVRSNTQFVVQPFYLVSSVVAINAQPQGTPPRLNLLTDKMYGPAGQVADYDWPNPVLRVSSIVALTTGPPGSFTALLSSGTVTPLPAGTSYQFQNIPVPRVSSVVATISQTQGTAPRLNLLVDKIYAGAGQVPAYDWTNPVLRVSSFSAITTTPLGSFSQLVSPPLTGIRGNTTYGQAFVADRTYLWAQPQGSSRAIPIPLPPMPAFAANAPNPVLPISRQVAITAQPLGTSRNIPFPNPLFPNGQLPTANPVLPVSRLVATFSQPLGVPGALITPVILFPVGGQAQPLPVLPLSRQTSLASQPLGTYANLVGTPPAIAVWVGVPLEYRSVDTQPLGIPPTFTPPQPPPIVNLPFVAKAIEPPYVALFSQPLGTWFNIEGCKVPYTPVPCPPGQYSAIANPTGSWSQVDCPPPSYTPVKTTC